MAWNPKIQIISIGYFAGIDALPIVRAGPEPKAGSIG
jgi:hypothetical protein